MGTAPPGILIPDWELPAGVCAAVTTRQLGGVSHPPFDAGNLGARCGDAPQHVAANRAVLRQLLALPADPDWLRQVHGAAVHVLREPADPARSHHDDPVADAAYTSRAGLVCAVQTADCLPLLLCNDAGSEVAAVHAGWRGLAGGVIEAAVAAFAAPPAQLRAWLGPAIAAASYEVGDEVRDAFVVHAPQAAAAFTPTRPGHWLCDLYLLARQRLEAAGVTRVQGGGLDTFSDPRFFSHRRDRPTGRFASLIWISSERERPGAEKAEAQSVKAPRAEAEKAGMQRVEAQRAEAEKAEMRRVEAQRVEAEQAETQRVEAQRAEAEQAETQRVEAQRVKTEKAEAQRTAAQGPQAQSPEVSGSPLLFPRLLGQAFASLPARVRTLHLAQGRRRYTGAASITRGRSLLARLCGLATGLPPAMHEAPLAVDIEAAPQREQWTRNFGGHRMTSRMWQGGTLLRERLGLVTFGFALSVEAGVLCWRVREVRALGLPLPAGWFQGVYARESESEGRYRFEVAAALPLAGQLVHYSGWLEVEPALSITGSGDALTPL
jgi:polyphenol oxidase